MTYPETFSRFFSDSERKRILFSFLVALALFSLGAVFSLLFEFSMFIPLGVGVAVFFFLLFLKDPLLFLLFIIPFRMTLDFFGESVSVQITERLSVSLSQAIGLLVFGIGVAFFAVTPRSREAFRVFFPFALFLAWASLSLFVSIAPSETLRDLLRVFDIFALMSIAFLSVKSFRDVKRVFVSVLLSSIIPLAFGVWQFASGSGYPKEFVDLERIYGTFGHPNVFGMYLFALMVVSLIFFRFFSETKREKIFAVFVGALSFFLLFPTLARVAWVITLFFFLSVAVFKFQKLLVPILVIPMLLFFAVTPIRDRITEALVPSADSSVLWRMNIWDDAFTRTVTENRVFFGSGLNSFPTIVAALHSEEFGSAEAHNDFVKFFVEGGIIGFSIFVLWMGWFAFRLFALSRDSRRSEKERELSLFMLLFLVSLLLASLSDAVFKSTPIQWIFWITLGAILGLEVKKQEKLPVFSKFPNN